MKKINHLTRSTRLPHQKYDIVTSWFKLFFEFNE